MTNIKDENQVEGKKARKEDTKISLTFIVLIMTVLTALLIYIFLKPHEPNPVSKPHSEQMHTTES